MKQLILISFMGLLLTACGKSSETTTNKEISNFPVKSSLTKEELKMKDALLEARDIDEKDLVKLMLKYQGQLTELNLDRIESHIEVHCKSGHCTISDRNN